MNKGSVSILNAIFIFVLLSALISIFYIHKRMYKLSYELNRKDAHALSVVGFYVDTIDSISWANDKLKKLSIFYALVPFVPVLAELVPVADLMTTGLEKYQDILLKKLKLMAPIYDFNLRRKNKLSLVVEKHFLTHRRQSGINIGVFKIPRLIEFNKSIFKTACVSHKDIFLKNRICIDSKDYKNTEKTWFAPSKTTWSISFKNVY
jgi:hypothetical protein